MYSVHLSYPFLVLTLVSGSGGWEGKRGKEEGKDGEKGEIYKFGSFERDLFRPWCLGDIDHKEKGTHVGVGTALFGDSTVSRQSR